MMAANRRGLQISNTTSNVFVVTTNNASIQSTTSTSTPISSSSSSSVLSSSARNSGLSTFPGSRSIPSILSRKRKADVLEDKSMDLAMGRTSSTFSSFPSRSNSMADIDENDCLIISENRPPPSKMNPTLGASTSSTGLSSRTPLSSLQNSLNNGNGLKPSDNVGSASLMRIPRPLPKFKPERTTNQNSFAQATKKVVLRQSWSEFREFIRTSTDNFSRSKTPFPALKWANEQTMWDFICKKESGMYKRKTGDEILARHSALQSRMRAILFDWLIEVCEVYKLHRETFYLAVDFIDRYLSSTKDMPKTRLQLIGVTCLFVGAKIEEIYPPKLSDFAYVTDGACSEEEILAMELVVLKELKWGLSPMTPHGWIKMFMQVSNCDNSPSASETFVVPQFSGLPFARAMQLLDICILDIESLSYKYSVIAASALAHLHSRELALAVSGYQWSDIAHCHLWMSAFVQALRDESPLQPKMFHNIQIENQHNIQSHSVELSTLDRAHEYLTQQKDMATRRSSTPEPMNTSCPSTISSGTMTPPSSERKDFERMEHVTPATPTSSKSTTGLLGCQNDVHFQQQIPQGFPSVFLTPETPNALRPMNHNQPKLH